MISGWENFNQTEKVEFIRSNPKELLSVNVQLFLVKDECRRVREIVLESTNEESVLAEGAFDENVVSRILVAKKTKRIEVLRVLADDKFFWVKSAVAQNPSIDKNLASKFLFSEDKDLQGSILSNEKIAQYPNLLRSYAQQGSEKILALSLLEIIDLDPEVFKILLKEKNPVIIKKTISHKNFPREFFEPYEFIYQGSNNLNGNELNEVEKIMLGLVYSAKSE